MARVIRTRSVQPKNSFGIFVAALVLIGLIGLDWLTWYTLLLVIVIVPIVDGLTAGRTHVEETRIEKDI